MDFYCLFMKVAKNMQDYENCSKAKIHMAAVREDHNEGGHTNFLSWK